MVFTVATNAVLVPPKKSWLRLPPSSFSMPASCCRRIRCDSSSNRDSAFANPKPNDGAGRRSKTEEIERLWTEFFADPSQWWDNSNSKISSSYPDFKHRVSREALWIDGRYNPPWVASKLAEWTSKSKQFPQPQAYEHVSGNRRVKKELRTDRMRSFMVRANAHPRDKEIDAELKQLIKDIKAAGYVPNTRLVSREMNEDKKEFALCHHSEKRAIAFALISTAPDTVIRIYNNLRMCPDCHEASKLISKVRKREIVTRDANRFHHFKDGACSCADYW